VPGYPGLAHRGYRSIVPAALVPGEWRIMVARRDGKATGRRPGAAGLLRLCKDETLPFVAPSGRR